MNSHKKSLLWAWLAALALMTNVWLLSANYRPAYRSRSLFAIAAAAERTPAVGRANWAANVPTLRGPGW